MVIHVEVVVVKGGIHRMPEELDFGTLTSMQEKRSLELSLLNRYGSYLSSSLLR